MDVHINNVDSNLHVADSDSLLNPGLMRQIVQAVLAELQRQEEIQQRQMKERAVQASALSEQNTWSRL